MIKFLGGMSISAVDLPQEVLCYIFSYLEPKDLCRAAQVCRSWNVAQKTDGLWQNLCRSILDLQMPFRGSWKEQYQVLHRWETGDLREVYFPTISKFFHEIGDFTILEDNTAIGVIPLSHITPLLYSVRTLANGKELATIDLEQWGCCQISDSELCGTTWTIVDERAKIFQFNICTGVCLNRFEGDFEPGRAPHLHCNDQEIVTAVGNRVRIWDLQHRRLGQVFEVASIQEISVIRSTPNYVFCFCLIQEGEPEFILAVNKKDPTKQIRIEGNAVPYSMESCGVYFSFLTVEGTLCVYEDEPSVDLQLIRTLRIVETPTPWPGTVQMYRNWVAVSKDEVFRVFDVRTGNEIALPSKDRGYDFRFNAQTVLFRCAFADSSGMWTNAFCLYDFGGSVRQLSTEGMRDQGDLPRCCLTM